jgi:hypothetical protein
VEYPAPYAGETTDKAGDEDRQETHTNP